MLAASIPTKFPIPWGNGAQAPYIRTIPTGSQIGIQNGAASLTDGFPPLCFTPLAGGGSPMYGEDYNGIFNQTSAWSQWQAAGGPVYFDAAFSSSIGGYPKGAILAQANLVGGLWLNLVENNATDPDTGGANWLSLYQGGRYSFNAASPPSADVPLGVGDKLTITYSSLSSVAMHVNCTAGGVYRVLWYAPISNSVNTDLGWLPNNTTYTNAFSSINIEPYDYNVTGVGSTTGGAPSVGITYSPYVGLIPLINYHYKNTSTFYFDIFGGPTNPPDNINDIGPFCIDAIAMTNTSGKVIKSIATVRGGPCLQWAQWEDTSTAWTSLGTIYVGAAPSGGNATTTGTVYIERYV